MACPVCNNPINKIKFSVFDDRYGYPGRFQLYHCRACRHYFLEHSFTTGDLTELYTTYYPRSEISVDQYAPHRETRGFGVWIKGSRSSAFRWVPQNVRVLDIGCGFGQSLGYHQARGCEAHGVETDRNALRIAEAHGLNIRIGAFSASDYPEAYFDYVTMDQVVEHLIDPVTVLKGIYRILKPGGTLVLSTPNAGGWGARVFRRRWINWHAPYHLHYFTSRSLKAAVHAAGFDVTQSRTITSSSWLDYQWHHLLFYPSRPGTTSWFWKPKRLLNRVEHWSARGISCLHRFYVNHLITRMADAAGIGDNLLLLAQKR